MLAGVAELVDALDSKSSNSNVVRVRFPPPVQNKIIREAIQKVASFSCAVHGNQLGGASPLWGYVIANH